ncbi:MAG: hypothetical protein GC154_19600 [bacterium]|nr:hypothetical protein [bacterium]
MNEMSSIVPYDCWNVAGVAGDLSCPLLAEHVHCRNCPAYTDAGRRLLERPRSPEYGREWTALAAAPKASSRKKTFAVTLFRLGRERFAMTANAFNQVYEPQPWRRIPHMKSPVLLGLINLAGELHLYVSLARLMGVALAEEGNAHQGKTAYPRVALIGAGEKQWAFHADEMYGVHRIDPAEIADPPSTIEKSASPFIKGVFQCHDDRIGLINESVLFDSLKRSVY